MNQLLTVDEASSLLRLSKSTLYSYIARQKIPHIKLGTRVLFASPDLEEWIQSNSTAKTTAGAPASDILSIGTPK